MRETIQETVNISIQCINLFLLFLSYHVLLNLLISLPFHFSTTNGDTSAMGNYVFIVIGINVISFFTTPLFYAGLYSVVFLKMQSRKFNATAFFDLAIFNFKNIFFISLIQGFILGIVFSKLNLFILNKIPSIETGSSLFITLNGFLSGFELFAISLFFVFAYPLVILGFFAESKLKPIRTSFTIVANHTKEIIFIILLLFLIFILGRIFALIIPSNYMFYRFIFMPLITAPLSFMIIIYSFLFLTKYFYKDLRFNFAKKTTVPI